MVTKTLDMTKKIMDYFNEYPDLFTDLEKKYIIAYAKNIYKYKFIPDVIREVYDELGFIPDENNIYIGFTNLIKDIHNLKDKNIVEVGGGVLPRLGKRITSTSKLKSFTVYDPRLSHYEMDLEKLKLVRKKFDISTNLNDTDLLIGLMPCEACDVIIESAIKNKVDFVVALCEGGPHGDEFDYYDSEDEWREDIIKHTRLNVIENNMGKLKIKYMREYGNPYPVIYNDRG